jgi:HSP20 family molecular chaperone IbpA
MPGVNRGELDVTLEKSVLTISGRVPQRIPGAARTLVQEYGVGDYQRQFNFGRLAEQVNRDAITAEYANGLLTVHLPKTAAAKPTKVNVALRS